MRYVVFLRGINIGGRRVSSDELLAPFSALGFQEPTAFMASGNVILDSAEEPGASGIERALQQALGYAVPTFVRSGDEVPAACSGTTSHTVRTHNTVARIVKKFR
ncbi:MAG: DUF1697 domain-containing protein [Acidimicrobiales bacterium]|jgi:uncharacterized protein (DUF1697 family)